MGLIGSWIHITRLAHQVAAFSLWDFIVILLSFISDLALFEGKKQKKPQPICQAFSIAASAASSMAREATGGLPKVRAFFPMPYIKPQQPLWNYSGLCQQNHCCKFKLPGVGNSSPGQCIGYSGSQPFQSHPPQGPDLPSSCPVTLPLCPHSALSLPPFPASPQKRLPSLVGANLRRTPANWPRSLCWHHNPPHCCNVPYDTFVMVRTLISPVARLPKD